MLISRAITLDDYYLSIINPIYNKSLLDRFTNKFWVNCFTTFRSRQIVPIIIIIIKKLENCKSININ
ncbi:hypothetical protein BLOT_009289, partial [Blomia tropicalis]